MLVVILCVIALGAIIYFIANSSKGNQSTTSIPSTTTIARTMTPITTMPPTTIRYTTMPPTTMPPTPKTSQQKSWSVNWMPQTGYVNFITIDNKVALHLNIRETITVVTSYDGSNWGSQITLSQLHSAPRPLNLIITFNTSTGFTINYQGQDIAVLPNRLNVTNANDLKILTESGITVNEPYYVLQDPVGIKLGQYKNVSNNTFGLNNNDLNSWNITILVNSTNYLDSWQGIIGNMRNGEVENGWGLWINPTGYIHFRILEWNENLESLGNLLNNTSYRIVINFYNNIYKITLTNLSTNVSNTIAITNKPKLVSNKGFITIGGFNGELFNGNINLVEFNTTERSVIEENKYKCNYKDTSYCILKDYRLDGSNCKSPSQTNANYTGLNNYSTDQLREWLDKLYNSNKGDSSTGERSNVIDYVKRCKSFSNYSFLNNTIAGKL